MDAEQIKLFFMILMHLLCWSEQFLSSFKYGLHLRLQNQIHILFSILLLILYPFFLFLLYSIILSPVVSTLALRRSEQLSLWRVSVYAFVPDLTLSCPGIS